DETDGGHGASTVGPAARANNCTAGLGEAPGPTGAYSERCETVRFDPAGALVALPAGSREPGEWVHRRVVSGPRDGRPRRQSVASTPHRPRIDPAWRAR